MRDSGTAVPAKRRNVPGNEQIPEEAIFLLEIDNNITKYREEFPVKMILVGTGQELQETEVLSITGPYIREQLPGIIETQKINLIFIPSVWPETFSYTAQEAIEMGMPVAVFDLGAPAERVKKYSKGLIIEKIDAEYALRKILEFTNGTRI